MPERSEPAYPPLLLHRDGDGYLARVFMRIGRLVIPVFRFTFRHVSLVPSSFSISRRAKTQRVPILPFHPRPIPLPLSISISRPTSIFLVISISLPSIPYSFAIPLSSPIPIPVPPPLPIAIAILLLAPTQLKVNMRSLPNLLFPLLLFLSLLLHLTHLPRPVLPLLPFKGYTGQPPPLGKV